MPEPTITREKEWRDFNKWWESYNKGKLPPRNINNFMESSDYATFKRVRMNALYEANKPQPKTTRKELPTMINLPNVKGVSEWTVMEEGYPITITNSDGSKGTIYVDIFIPSVPFDQLNDEVAKKIYTDYIWYRDPITGNTEHLTYDQLGNMDYMLDDVKGMLNFEGMKTELLKRGATPDLLEMPQVSAWLEEQASLRQFGAGEDKTAIDNFLRGVTDLIGQVQREPEKAKEILPLMGKIGKDPITGEQKWIPNSQKQEPSWGDVGNAENWRQNLINALQTEGYTSEAEHVKSVIDKLSPTLQTPRPAGESGMIWQQTQDVVTEQQQRLQQLEGGASQSFTPESVAARAQDEAEGDAAAEESALARKLEIEKKQKWEREAPWRRLVEMSSRPSKIVRL